MGRSWRWPGLVALSQAASGGCTVDCRTRPAEGLRHKGQATIAAVVAPAHGEVRLGVVPGDFGGNFDISDLTEGVTLYLRANVDGGHIYIGDGHYAQGDGGIAGTAVEGAFFTTLSAGKAVQDESFDWPRLETESLIGVIGCARPLDDAARIAVAGLVRRVAHRTGLDTMDAHQLVSQTCGLRFGNVVNPAFTVLCTVPKAVLSQ